MINWLKCWVFEKWFADWFFNTTRCLGLEGEIITVGGERAVKFKRLGRTIHMPIKDILSFDSRQHDQFLDQIISLKDGSSRLMNV